jgi:hypothetical protein
MSHQGISLLDVGRLFLRTALPRSRRAHAHVGPGDTSLGVETTT